MKYVIIMAGSVQELQIEVNNFLLQQNGFYTLAGGPFYDNQAYCQAVYSVDFMNGEKQLLKD